MKAWLEMAFERSVRARALKVAVVVGSILAVINYTDAFLLGTLTLTSWTKIGLTYVVPYCVSTFSSVQTLRQRALAE